MRGWHDHFFHVEDLQPLTICSMARGGIQAPDSSSVKDQMTTKFAKSYETRILKDKRSVQSIFLASLLQLFYGD